MTTTVRWMMMMMMFMMMMMMMDEDGLFGPSWNEGFGKRETVQHWVHRLPELWACRNPAAGCFCISLTSTYCKETTWTKVCGQLNIERFNLLLRQPLLFRFSEVQHWFWCSTSGFSTSNWRNYFFMTLQKTQTVANDRVKHEVPAQLRLKKFYH